VLRLLTLVEGETEETFVNEVLAPHLLNRGFARVDAKLMGNARLRSQRGGVRGWPEVKSEILRHLKADKQIFLTIMVDYYGMPGDPKKARAWPGRHEAIAMPAREKGNSVAAALAADIGKKLRDVGRFIPFVLVHEFEAVLFSDCERFASAIGRNDRRTNFLKIRSDFQSPEEINDSPQTHPSQRILDLVPEYRKPIHGNLAALEIGIETICRECEHFRGWIERLEQLAR
jgi:Domain of unknown function (DUF4276)